MYLYVTSSPIGEFPAKTFLVGAVSLLDDRLWTVTTSVFRFN